MNEPAPDTSHTRAFGIVGFAGSLRRNSSNRAPVRAAAELASLRLNVSTRELNDLPLYNADVEAAGVPHIAGYGRHRQKDVRIVAAQLIARFVGR